MISIIMPVYNSSDYLDECLKSILKQTFKDFELICIDDGSTDNSLIILEEYAIRDSRIKVISQKNQGAAVARNKGIELAKGEYISFIDSDDVVKPTFLETFDKYKDIADCVEVNLSFYKSKNKDIENWFKNFYLNNPSQLYTMSPYTITQINACLWNKLFKKSIIEKYNIRFPKKIITEDNFFTYSYLVHCKNIYYHNEKLYLYRQDNVNSVSNKYRKKFTKSYYDIAQNYILLAKHYKKYKKTNYNKSLLLLLNKNIVWDISLLINSKDKIFINRLKKILKILNISGFENVSSLVRKMQINLLYNTNPPKVQKNFTRKKEKSNSYDFYKSVKGVFNSILIDTNLNIIDLPITSKIDDTFIIDLRPYTLYFYMSNIAYTRDLKLKSFKINDKELLKKTQLITNDSYFAKPIFVKANEITKIHIEYFEKKCYHYKYE